MKINMQDLKLLLFILCHQPALGLHIIFCLAETKGEIISILPESRQYNPSPTKKKKKHQIFKTLLQVQWAFTQQTFISFDFSYISHFFFSVLVICMAREKEEQECSCSSI